VLIVTVFGADANILGADAIPFGFGFGAGEIME
jgi:hypothetical protein